MNPDTTKYQSEVSTLYVEYVRKEALLSSNKRTSYNVDATPVTKAGGGRLGTNSGESDKRILKFDCSERQCNDRRTLGCGCYAKHELLLINR